MIHSITIALVFASVALFLSCSSSKAVKRDTSADENKQETVQQKDLQPVTTAEMTEDELTQLKKIMDLLKDIPFDFDSYTIPTEGMDILRSNVDLLNAMLEKRGKMIVITIEGHTDERGSEEYNLALGERRAKTVKEYLFNVGFHEGSLKVISYGEEKPKVAGSSVEAWAANRRAHLIVE
ncbi:MAG: hypothetical protein A2268_06650 [Candidatus Raymondbacteria bacterium RifOxyA12_full_50_37]|uniref:Peptidoglycan-associated protein n=1 Tax=Candidatus Raymondbacteria bacterium RIFOXYD12_FULL_49_13 TaxID=1817890 RepID=A0A1F7F781_UNCRA|nr:MAG: hypothetical protein A2268_06650 [Candidatus Raymondbacteria bacterium RifOxyA12_full_50_37]OGJ88746.1 MAG: hypothetical protein A2248_07790 [Candidatus Raymondbacteria bacterium RIFOXYA2_FULL_49_16]OGJ99011.1 MAG: hypothetical protein A2350_06675 [Candidatus Raymondbacteria bacterium RifOxyB12_full_50_8]OGK01278.1 MAG: hypothetical protein A2487_09800 [Candidatus Raymondbacteria bacterium RifOxyC12_full_50_8]OGK02530.1 MAG: hypothetical protein A2519_12045 [Candidatus Raymondbacteria b